MDLYARYAEFIGQFLKIQQPIKVVFDCSNGTTGLVIKKLSNSVSKKLNVILINDTPDGNFPAHGPDPLKPDALRDLAHAAQKHQADCGVIFDADGDRVFFVDEKGEPLTADNAAILVGEDSKGGIILDVRMGYGVREWCAAHERPVIDSRVGHSFIKKLMREKNISYAAELSGHYYFSDFFYCDSGIFAAIRFLNAVSGLKKNSMTLSQWIVVQPHYYQSGEMNFNVTDKAGAMARIEGHFRKEATSVSNLDGIRMEFSSGKRRASPSEASASGLRSRSSFGGVGKDWWFNVRPSNTENLLRLNLEAKTKKEFDHLLSDLKKLIGSAE